MKVFGVDVPEALFGEIRALILRQRSWFSRSYIAYICHESLRFSRPEFSSIELVSELVRRVIVFLKSENKVAWVPRAQQWKVIR